MGAPTTYEAPAPKSTVAAATLASAPEAVKENTGGAATISRVNEEESAAPIPEAAPEAAPEEVAAETPVETPAPAASAE